MEKYFYIGVAVVAVLGAFCLWRMIRTAVKNENTELTKTYCDTDNELMRKRGYWHSLRPRRKGPPWWF